MFGNMPMCRVGTAAARRHGGTVAVQWLQMSMWHGGGTEVPGSTVARWPGFMECHVYSVTNAWVFQVGGRIDFAGEKCQVNWCTEVF